MRAVILAAGKGTRLRAVTGGAPKPLTRIPDGRMILGQQLDNLATIGIERDQVSIVVGYRADDVIDAAPGCRFVHNDAYDTTNTAKSLLRALRRLNDNVVWLNGDVVFDPLLFGRFDWSRSGMAVNRGRVADEEVKYTVGADGCINELGKTAPYPVDWAGEAVGVNYVTRGDLPNVTWHLRHAHADEYYEDALREAIRKGAVTLRPFDVTGLRAVEVDTPEDYDALRA